MKVRVDRDLCIGVGNCVALAPTVFAFDEENKAIVLEPASRASIISLSSGITELERITREVQV